MIKFFPDLRSSGDCRIRENKELVKRDEELGFHMPRTKCIRDAWFIQALLQITEEYIALRNSLKIKKSIIMLLFK